MSRDHYGIVGVGADASEKEITKAFRAKARKLHPDKQPPGASDAEKLKAKKAFQELVNSYEVLRDPNKRARYNLERSDDIDEPQPGPQSSAGQRPTAPPPRSGDGAGRRRGRQDETEGPEERRRREEEQERAFKDEARRFKEQQERRRRQEEQSKEALRMRQQKESDRKGAGLGSHWVKPPPDTGKPIVPPNIKIVPGTGGVKGSTDDDSDASSVLSFDIYEGLDMTNIVFDDNDDEMANDEVWTIHRPSGQTEGQKSEFTASRGKEQTLRQAAGADPKEWECPACGFSANSDTNEECGACGAARPSEQGGKQEADAKAKRANGTAKPCCAVQ